MKMLRISLCMFAFVCLYAVVRSECVVNEIVTKEDFDMEKYQGKWYEIYYKTKTFYTDADNWLDVYQTYSIRPDGALVMDFVARLPITKKCIYLNGSLTQTNEIGKLNYTDNFGSKNYWVLDTDYRGYSVVYGCSRPDMDGKCTIVDTLDIWVFSRTMTLTPDQLSTVTEVLQNACVDVANLTSPGQVTKCEADAGPDDCSSNSAGSIGPFGWLFIAPFIWKTLY